MESAGRSPDDALRKLVQHAEPLDAALALERVLRVLAGNAVRAVQISRHRIPGPRRTQPRAAVVREQHEAVVSGSHEVALMRGQIEVDQRLAALPHRALRGSSSPYRRRPRSRTSARAGRLRAAA
jgi:hypothetical protein